MRTSVLILSEDAVFARMLELELGMHRISARVQTEASEGEDAGVILADLDTAVIPATKGGIGIIGFTRSNTVSASDPERRCSMILHRPFEVCRLVEEIEGMMQNAVSGDEVGAALSLSSGHLSFGERSVALSPKEALVMELLLSRRGTTVTREEIARVIGMSEANKPEVYICHLRGKLETLSRNLTLRTVRGQGYRLEKF